MAASDPASTEPDASWSDAELRALDALRHLLRSSHLSRADELPKVTHEAAVLLGATGARIYLADYDQVVLVPLVQEGAVVRDALTIDSTLAGRSFRDIATHVRADRDGMVVWAAIIDGAERLGVLEVAFAAGIDVDGALLQSLEDLAGLVASSILSHGQYGDAIERSRRRQPLTLPAELQWNLLPPLTFVSPRVSISGVLAPTNEVAGDSFDYSINGHIAHVAIVDAMGHGLQAALMAVVAIGELRNARRRGLDLHAVVPLVDAVIADTFGPDKFVTGIIGELDTTTGMWTWATCGHPPALLVRHGKVVKRLDSVIDSPLGLGLLRGKPKLGSERLEPGDRLLLYTDGVIEARDEAGEFFGTDRLVDFVVKHAASGMPTAEALRRLNHEILDYQHGVLQDDATTVMVDWLSDEVGRTFG
jgi:phosphoserine phosphatase RsbU/P